MDKPPKVVILDDNPLSVTSYIEEYGDIFSEKKPSRIQNTKRWIRRRLRDILHRGYDESFTAVKQPHRLHKRHAFACNKHNCTVCREDEKAHRKKVRLKENGI